MENTFVIPHIQGMSTDTREKFQPQGKARYILNGILETLQGDAPSISNDFGNTLCATLPQGYVVIGARQLDGDDFIIFSANGTSSEIGIFNPNQCTYTTTINDPCLNFYLDKRIKVEFRILKGCERIIYFTDGINPYRVLNLDDLPSYYVDGVFDCSKLELSRPLLYPCISDIQVQDFGGQLRMGTYKFRIRLLDSNNNPTNWYHLTPPTPIYDESQATTYAAIDGGLNIIDQQYVDGAVPQTSKSIELTITNLDQSFTHYQLAVIGCTEGTGFANEAYILKPKPISSTTSTYVFTGPNPTTDEETDITSLQIDPGIIDIVEAHAQIDSRLVLGGLSNKAYDYASIQKAANTIKTEWEYSTEIYGNMAYGTSKSPKAYISKRSWMRDEVAAFGIKGHHIKGWSTPVFHIPGRASITDPQLINLGNSNPHYRNKLSSTVPNWDTQNLFIVPSDANIGFQASVIHLSDVEHLGYTEADLLTGTVPRWKVYNTAIQYSSSNRGLMGYYETTEDYPDTLDCDGNRIYPLGKIRHHRFPDTTLVPMHSISNPPIDEFIQLDEEEDADNTFPTIPAGTEQIHPLGAVFDLNTFLALLPQEILDDFIEWEIVVAVRDEYSKTILDKGYIISSSNVLYGNPDEDPPSEELLAKYLPGWSLSDNNSPDFGFLVPRNISPAFVNDKISMFLSPKETF